MDNKLCHGCGRVLTSCHCVPEESHTGGRILKKKPQKIVKVRHGVMTTQDFV